MKLLALDSSGTVASAALLEDGALLAEYTVNYKKTHSQTLLPMLDKIVRMTETDLASIDAIAIAKGPGSFTGLRIGSATAKGLGLALNKPIVEVPTVDALAYNLYDAKGLVVPMMDARRQQVYTGIYRFEEHVMKTVREQFAAPIDDLAAALNELGEPVILIGDGVPVYRNRMRELLTVPFTEAPAHLSRQRAGAVGALGMIYLAEGRTVSAADHVPEYLRKSQAEREHPEGVAEAESKQVVQNFPDRGQEECGVAGADRRAGEKGGANEDRGTKE